MIFMPIAAMTVTLLAFMAFVVWVQMGEMDDLP